MSTPGSNRKGAIGRDLAILIVLGAILFAVVATQASTRTAAIATIAYAMVALMVFAYRYDARETAAEAALQKQSQEQAEPHQLERDEAQSAETVASGPASEEPIGVAEPQDQYAASGNHREMSTDEDYPPQELRTTFEQDGEHGHEEEEAGQQAAVATQTISPALYGTGIVDEVSGRIGQVNLLETGLNVLAKVDSSGTIEEVNEGMEVVTGVPRDELLGTDAFSYFTEPDSTRSWFMEAVQGSSVRDKEVEVMHQEGETTPLTYNVIATIGKDQSGGVLLCRYRED